MGGLEKREEEGGGDQLKRISNNQSVRLFSSSGVAHIEVYPTVLRPRDIFNSSYTLFLIFDWSPSVLIKNVIIQGNPLVFQVSKLQNFRFSEVEKYLPCLYIYLWRIGGELEIKKKVMDGFHITQQPRASPLYTMIGCADCVGLRP